MLAFVSITLSFDDLSINFLPVLIISGLFWEEVTPTSHRRKEFYNSSLSTLANLQQHYVLCVNGTPLVHKPSILAEVTPFVTIFARMSPQQKGDVVRVTKEKGEYCLMCGDGTNDVAALKIAHCGVSIMSNVEVEEKMAVAEMQYMERLEENEESSLIQNSPALKV